MTEIALKVSRAGRRVVIEFDLPFVAGDPCIHPTRLGRASVKLAPELTIRLGGDLSVRDVHYGGSWYVTPSGQMSGAREYCADEGALLSFWMAQPLDRLSVHLGSVLKAFPDFSPSLLKRREELVRSEIAGLKEALGGAAVETASKIATLEAALPTDTLSRSES